MATTNQAEQARQLIFVEHLSYRTAARELGLTGKGVWKICNPEGRQRVESSPVVTEAEHDIQRDALTRVYKQAHPRARK